MRRDGDHYVLHGAKTWISNAENADFFLTYGTIDKSKGMRGICCFVVDRDTPGISIAPILNKAGARSQGVAQVFFDDVRVPASHRLLPEGEGYKALMTGTEIGRLACAARAVGQIRTCLDLSVAYAKQRVVFGQPIGKYQLIQAKIADIRVALDAATLLRGGSRGCSTPASSAARRRRRSRSCTPPTRSMQSAEHAYQIHGAYGVAEEYQVGRIFRDAKVTQIYDGTNEIHQTIIGEWELGYRAAKAA